MQVVSYFYKTPNKAVDKANLIKELDRAKYMNQQYIAMAKEYLQSISMNGRVAVLYAGGATISNSEGRNSKDKGEYALASLDTGLAIRELSSHNMHKYIGMLKDRNKVVYANINANACASSMYTLYEAERLMEHEGIDEVVVITEDMISYNTIRVFDEHNIPVIAGDGLAIMHLSKEHGNGPVIADTEWGYDYNRNPFAVTKEGYSSVAKSRVIDNITNRFTKLSDNDLLRLIHRV